MIQRQEYFFSFCGVVQQGDSESRTKNLGRNYELKDLSRVDCLM